LLFLLKKELIHVHEFEVDEQMYGKYKNDYIKHLLAYALGTNSSQLLLTSQFYNKLTLTKRTKIMKNSIKKHKLLILTLPLAALAFSLVQCDKPEELQTSPETAIVNTEQKAEIYDIVDDYPEYPGGQEAMIGHIVDNVTYPENAKNNYITGTAYTQFIVSKTGKIKDVEIVAGKNKVIEIDKELADEAMRVVKLMPNWIPGKIDGESVNVRYTLPIKFALD
jgi:TonB family protein